MAKIIIAVALLWWLFESGVIDAKGAVASLSRLDVVLPVSLCIFLAILVSSYRWYLLLHSQNFDISLWQTLRIRFIGLFFANFMPGAVGGDVVNAFYIYRAVPERRTAAVSTIIADRMIGIFGLLTVGIVIGAWQLDAVLADKILAAIFVFMVVGFLVALLLVCIVGWTGGAAISRWSLPGAHGGGSIKRLIRAAIEAIATYRRNIKVLITCWGLSIVINILTIFAVVIAALSMGIEGATIEGYSLAAPLALIANFIPLTPGGIGVGEAAFDQICKLIMEGGSEISYGAGFLIFRAVSLAITLPGVLVYVIYRRENNPAEAIAVPFDNRQS